MTELTTLCPKDEKIRVGYYNKQEEPLFFLTSPAKSTSSLAAETGAFTLYEVIPGTRPKVKKLGQGGNPTELELKYGVREKLTA